MKQMIICCKKDITQMALLDNHILVEFAVEYPQEHQLVNCFYKGRIVNVIPGMQAVFIDIGLNKNAFMHVNDMLPIPNDQKKTTSPPITQRVRVGQEMIVQIMKEPVGSKGARVTSNYALPGRYVVYMPYGNYIGVSHKIESTDEGNRLRYIGEQACLEGEGVIIRTAALGQSEKGIVEDIVYLRQQWRKIQQDAAIHAAPQLLYQDLDLIFRFIRDVFTTQIEEVVIDNRYYAMQIKDFVKQTAPELVQRIHVYKGKSPILQKYGIQEQVKRSFQRKVWLSNGSYIVIDHTEALTAIDVNTGKYVGTDQLEETVFQTNLAAAIEIARLMRLQDIGGIILIDFIDMPDETYRRVIVEQLEKIIKKDRTKCLIVGWTKLGLLEITRKKVRDHAMHDFFKPCHVCKGSGLLQMKPILPK